MISFSNRLIKINQGVIEEISSNLFQSLKSQNKYYLGGGGSTFKNKEIFRDLKLKVKETNDSKAPEISIKIEFFDVQTIFMFGISFHLYEYVNLFELSNYENVSKGNSSYTLTFPTTFLNEGVYKIDFFAFDKEEVLFLKKNIASIEIGELLSEYKSWGKVRPPFFWTKG